MPHTVPQSMLKICILGDGGVGKTTLVTRYLTGVFEGRLKITIGVNFYVKKVEYNNKLFTLQLWDFAGEDRFRFILPSYLLGASGAIFMYDITRYSSFKNFESWHDVFLKGSERNEAQIPLLMVGSKLDLEYKRAVSLEDAQGLANSFNHICDYIECSAKTGKNVEYIFKKITKFVTNNSSLF
ncbi:MAG: Rab family GTPase [Candidatus Hermodarchaeota archaeon]